MYSKKYILADVEEFKHINPIYVDARGSISYPAYFNVGERGWFLYIEGSGWHETAHRIHTSKIEKVDYFDDRIVVKTQNTILTFKLVG